MTVTVDYTSVVRVPLVGWLFGADVGVHPTYVSQVERGLLSPTLTKLGAMATWLDITPSTLLRRAERSL